MSARLSHVAAAALALLVLLMPLVAAQQGSGALTIRVTPSSLDLAAGSTKTAQVVVENDGLGVMVVALSAVNVTGNLRIVLSPSELTILPGGTAQATANVTGNVTGDWQATLVAQQENGLGGNGAARASAVLRVTVSPPAANATNATNATSAPQNATAPSAPTPSPTPPQNTSAPPPTPAPTPPPSTTPPPTSPAPASPSPQPAPAPATPLRVNATELTVSVARGERGSFSVSVDNPRSVAQRIDASLRLPIGWGGTLEATPLHVGAGERAAFRGTLSPNAQARDDEGSLVLTTSGWSATVRLHLLVDGALAPLAADDDAAAGSAPQPPSDAADERAGASPEQSALRLRVEPAEVAAPPGAHVVLTLYLTNLGPTAVDGMAAFGATGLPLDVASPAFFVAPGEESAVTFVARIPEDARPGTRYVGSASALGTHATFAVQADGVDLTAVSTRTVQQAEDGAPLWLGFALGGALAGGISLAAVSRRWPMLGLAALYARLAPQRALEHPRRQQMLALLRAEPGVTLADAQRRLALSNGVARHHVQLLVSAGVIRIVQDGALRRLYPTEAPRAEPTPALRERALTAIRARGEVRASDLAQELGVSRQALHYHLKRLETEGAIRARREGIEVTLEPAAS